jgi:YesN/AraC family two-component response regulator
MFAKQYYLNQSYLSQLFATETGENFSTYISVLRIKKAKELLKSTNFSTSKVGELVGYKERSYFTKVFEKYEKVTPYKYRESIKK